MQSSNPALESRSSNMCISAVLALQDDIAVAGLRAS